MTRSQSRYERTHDKAYDQSSTISEIETTSVTGRLNVPLYQGGGVSTSVRRAWRLPVSVIDPWRRRPPELCSPGTKPR